MFEIALKEFKNYWSNGWHILLFVLALIYILICVKEKKIKKTFGWYCGLFVFIYACPLTVKIITNFIGEMVYWRMFWLLPSSIIMAFAFTHLYEKMSAKWLKAMAVVAMTLIVSLGGAWMYTSEEFVVAPNWHKVSVAVPGICEMIQADAAEQEIKPRIVVVNSLLSQIRQYDANIKMIYGRNAQANHGMTKNRRRVYAQMQEEMPDYTKLIKALKKLKCNYVVWTGSEESFAGFEENGFRLVGQVDRYKIFFMSWEDS